MGNPIHKIKMDMITSENRHLKLSRLFQKGHRWGHKGGWHSTSHGACKSQVAPFE